MKYSIVATLFLLSPAASWSQQSSDQHHRGVVERRDQVMGFAHDQTRHHFRLYKDGGSIEAVATDDADAASQQEIREHLDHIAAMFGRGNFNAPMLIHGRTPPGVPTMKALRNEIQYRVEETPRGARVRVSSQNPKAICAIHDFLRFQIRDHQTGDWLTISKD